MSSLTKDNRLLFKASDGKRKTIRLGKLPQKQRAVVQRHVDRLVACNIDGSAAPNETSRWLAEVGNTLRDRLERVGLVEPIAESKVLTLGNLLAEYTTRPRWLENKPATRVFQSKAFKDLVDYFGRDIPIDTLTEAKADDYHAHLQLSKSKGGRGLAMSTGNKQCAVAWALYRYAINARYLDRNPFDDVPRGMPRTDSNVFVPESICKLVLEELPDTEWKLLFALSRWGGLRTPSEQRRIRWCDVNWEKSKFLVHCSKTEHHVGHETRWVPMFPELHQLFDQRFSEAAEGDELVLPMMTKLGQSAFASRVKSAMTRAGVDHWPRVLHSLRATRQTELVTGGFEVHDVCRWLGNSEVVARKHYLQTTDDAFDKAAHFCAQHTLPQGDTEGKRGKARTAKALL
jgi:site-specific recombinase XerD